MMQTLNNNLNPENSHIAKYGSVIINAIHSQDFSFGDEMMIKINLFKQPLCACGCGKEVKRNKIKSFNWNKFVYGHQNKGDNNPAKRPEVRIAISKGHKGKLVGENNPAKRPEVRKKISDNNGRAMLNKHHSLSSRDKISKNHRDISGDKNPMKRIEQIQRMKNNNPSSRPDVRRAIAKTLKGRFVGTKNPSWKGGKSFQEYPPIWFQKEFKESIRERDNHQCQNPFCKHNSKKLILSIHHINGNKKDCKSKNLISVCNSCNSKAEGNKLFSRKFWEGMYNMIMSIKYGYIYE